MKIQNTLTRRLEKFEPLTPPKVLMYVCGPTVYDLLHVGNFRGPVVYNMIRNWLEYLGYEVTYALNFTDVDDKIIHRAQEKGCSSQELSQRYIQEYKRDYESLGLRPQNFNPTVTESIPEILDFISKLLSQKKAYVSNGDVFYRIDSFSEYGKLSGRRPEELLSGARVEVDEKKENPMDFALWKSAKPGEPFWSSPWGSGRPGWHIECSAMIHKLFGEQIDIHGGGTDLIFPHHENEIAQSEGLSGKSFVRYWLHVGMLNLGGQKMSKSLGNLVSLREFVQNYHSEVYKWMILSAHYHTIAEFSDVTREQSLKNLGKIYSTLAFASKIVGKKDDIKTEQVLSPAKRLRAYREKLFQIQNQGSSLGSFVHLLQQSMIKIESALSEDFHTPTVLAALFDLVKRFHQDCKHPKKSKNALSEDDYELYLKFFQSFGSVMALFQEEPVTFLRALDDKLLLILNRSREEIDQKIVERDIARKNREFHRADEIREELLKWGISVMDSPSGSQWEVTK